MFWSDNVVHFPTKFSRINLQPHLKSVRHETRAMARTPVAYPIFTFRWLAVHALVVPSQARNAELITHRNSEISESWPVERLERLESKGRSWWKLSKDHPPLICCILLPNICFQIWSESGFTWFGYLAWDAMDSADSTGTWAILSPFEPFPKFQSLARPGANGLLPGRHQLHAVHSALSRVRFSKMRRVLRLYEVFTKSFLSLDIILLTFTCLPYQPLQLSSFALFRLSGLCASSDRLDENHVRLEVAKFLRTELPLESRAFLTPTHGEGQAWQCRQLAEFFGADLHWTTTVTA